MPLSPGDRLLAKITKIERERGIFIAGHRFEPYRNTETEPWNIGLSGADGRAFAKRTIPLSLKSAIVFFSFFDRQDMLALFIAQDRGNAKSLASSGLDDILLRIHAYDMKTFYDEEKLEAGDYLDLELSDSSGTSFTLRPLKASSISVDRRKAWFTAMEEGAASAMRSLGRPSSPPEFIAAAFASAAAAVREEPAASFSEYFNESGMLQMKEYSGATFMWGRGDDIPALLMSAGNADSRTEDELDDLSRSLSSLGFALNSDEIAAFVRDALWRGERVEEALNRCFSGAEDLGLPRKKLEAVLGEARAFAQEIAAGWDRSAENPDTARIRSALLDIYAAFLGWMRKIGALAPSPADLDTEESPCSRRRWRTSANSSSHSARARRRIPICLRSFRRS